MASHATLKIGQLWWLRNIDSLCDSACYHLQSSFLLQPATMPKSMLSHKQNAGEKNCSDALEVMQWHKSRKISSIFEIDPTAFLRVVPANRRKIILEFCTKKCFSFWDSISVRKRVYGRYLLFHSTGGLQYLYQFGCYSEYCTVFPYWSTGVHPKRPETRIIGTIVLGVQCTAVLEYSLVLRVQYLLTCD